MLIKINPRFFVVQLAVKVDASPGTNLKSMDLGLQKYWFTIDFNSTQLRGIE